MLSEKYKNALNGFKAQGNASHLFEGCEAESQHIYRIIMTEGVPVNLLDEDMLEKFIAQESEGRADYSQYVDHDGLQYVDFEKDVEVYPCSTIGAMTYPIEGQFYLLSSLESKSMLEKLSQMGRLELITKTLQSLAEKLDGTQLQTAFPSIQELTDCIDDGLVLPKALLEKLKEWEGLGASEVNFDFVELQEQG